MSLFTTVDTFKISGKRQVMDHPADGIFETLESGFQTFQFKKWWNVKPTKIYLTCSGVKLVRSGLVRYLIWPYGSDVELAGSYDGSKITFTRIRNVSRMALLCGDRSTILIDYVVSPDTSTMPYENIRNTDCPGSPDDIDTDLCIPISKLPEFGEAGLRPDLPCVFGVPTDITTFTVLPD